MAILAKSLLALVAAILVFTYLGYTYRQYECRAEMIVVMMQAPGSKKLIPVSISSCSLPAQWGGKKAAVADEWFESR